MRMLNKVFTWLKARWQWGQGLCPACGRRLFGPGGVYNHNKDCQVCYMVHDDLTVWHNWRKRKPVSSAKVLHQQKAKITWRTKAKDAVVERE